MTTTLMVSKPDYKNLTIRIGNNKVEKSALHLFQRDEKRLSPLRPRKQKKKLNISTSHPNLLIAPATVIGNDLKLPDSRQIQQRLGS
jgi:hypothetical protein